MKILLAGEYYSENLGDPLLCRTVEQLIREAWPDAEIIPFDLYGRISPTELYQPKTAPVMDWITEKVCDKFLYYRRAAILRAYGQDKKRFLRVWYQLKALQKQHSFDLVIFAGGSLFMDFFAGVLNLILRRMAFRKTKVIFHACGMSDLTEDGEYLIRQVVQSKKVVSISLRDSYGEFLRRFPVGEKTVETFDTALNCSRLYEGAEEKTAPLGIGLIDRCYDQQLGLLRYFLSRDIPWKAFTNGSPYDQDYGRKLLLDAGIPESRIDGYLLPRPVTEGELVKTVTGFEKLIAFRMHSQIVAASFGVPSFGFAWDRKVTEFYQKLGFPQGTLAGTEDFAQVERLLETYPADTRQRALSQGEESRRCLLKAIDDAMKK